MFIQETGTAQLHNYVCEPEAPIKNFKKWEEEYRKWLNKSNKIYKPALGHLKDYNDPGNLSRYVITMYCFYVHCICCGL